MYVSVGSRGAAPIYAIVVEFTETCNQCINSTNCEFRAERHFEEPPSVDQQTKGAFNIYSDLMKQQSSIRQTIHGSTNTNDDVLYEKVTCE